MILGRDRGKQGLLWVGGKRRKKSNGLSLSLRPNFPFCIYFLGKLLVFFKYPCPVTTILRNTAAFHISMIVQRYHNRNFEEIFP